MTLDLLDPASLLDPRELGWLREHAERALAELVARAGCSGELRVRVVDDSQMAEAHERFSGVAGTTDVLTFDLAEHDEKLVDGDVLICADEAERQAERLGHERARELLLYTLHGALHAIGHDDTTDEGFARMHALEDEILGAIGVGATFAREPKEHTP